VKRRAILVVCVAAVLFFGLTACDGPRNTFGDGIIESIGLADPQPLPAIVIDGLCDSSEGAPCSAATLREFIDNVMPIIAERPGSVIRIWSLGSNLISTTLVATSTNTRRRLRSERAERAAEGRFVAEETADLMKKSASIFGADPARRSPIAEGFGRIALVHRSGGAQHLIVAISDALEFSSFGNWECGELPAATQWVSRLAEERVLTSGALRNNIVAFAHAAPVMASRKGCPAMTLARDAQVRDLWTSALKAAGASKVVFETGAVDINDYIPKHMRSGGAV
jgi:hypothetical protein